MAISYDVIPHEGGWAIVVTPARRASFATQGEALAAAIDYARKLRCEGQAVQVHVRHPESELVGGWP